MKINPEWEELGSQTRRMKVFGGWVVNSYSNEFRTESSVFVPDAEHKWEIK